MKKLMMIAAMFAFAGTAVADDMAKKAPDAKKEAPKAPEAKKDAPKDAAPKMEMPKPAPEVAEMAKMAGNWNCTGKFSMDGTKWTDFKGTNKMSVDLDKFWVKGESTMTAGPMKMKMTEYLTFDAGQKKWFRLSVDSMGGQETAWSADGKAWEGEARMMGMSHKVKSTVAMGPKEIKVTSESSMDGKKWMPAFDMTCKK
jgi:hypothetical protein